MKRTELKSSVIQANYGRACRIIKDYANQLHGLLINKEEGRNVSIIGQSKQQTKKYLLNKMVNSIGTTSTAQRVAIRNHIKRITKKQLLLLDKLPREELEEVINQFKLRQEELENFVVDISKQEKYNLLINVLTTEQDGLDEKLWEKKQEIFKLGFSTEEEYRDRYNAQPKDRQERNPL